MTRLNDAAVGLIRIIDWRIQSDETGRLSIPETEYRFHPTRRWRFDLAWPALGIAVEVEGGTFAGGRHTRGSGFEADCEKYNEAALLGWRVFRVTPHMIRDGRALAIVERATQMALRQVRFGDDGYPWTEPRPRYDQKGEQR